VQKLIINKTMNEEQKVEAVVSAGTSTEAAADATKRAAKKLKFW